MPVDCYGYGARTLYRTRHNRSHELHQPVASKRPSNGGVRVKDDEGLERALKRFAKYIKLSGTEKDIKLACGCFEKPSDRKRRLHNRNQRRRWKATQAARANGSKRPKR